MYNINHFFLPFLFRKENFPKTYKKKMWNLCRYTILETFIKDTCFDTRNISDIITKFLSEQTLNFPFWMFFCKKTKNHMPHAYNGKI